MATTSALSPPRSHRHHLLLMMLMIAPLPWRKSTALLSRQMQRATLSAPRYARSLSNVNSDSSDSSHVSPASWISRFPTKAQPYMRLARMDKPIGTWLLFLPCCWSTALAAAPGCLPDPVLLLQFATGAFIMRGAGCTINDLWDRDLDKKVQRTQSRPLAAGEISPRQALAFLGAQLCGGLAILSTFNATSIGVGMMSVPLVVVYPLMKRFTHWPQLFLGLTFNWGTWVGWSAVHNAVSVHHVFPLYAAGVFWTLIYDTLYAYQDRPDDIKTGIKSTPVLLGDHPQWTLTAFSGVMFGCLSLTGVLSDLSLPFYAGSVAAWGHVLWQIWTANLHCSANLDHRFRSNVYTGSMIFAAIAAGNYLQV